MDDTDTLVFRSICIADAARGILTSIVYQNQFPVSKCLGKDTVYTTRKEFFYIIYRYYN